MMFLRKKDGDMAICPLRVMGNMAAGKNAPAICTESFMCNSSCAWCCEYHNDEDTYYTCGLLAASPMFVGEVQE